ncbi:MAG: hypothetical protein NC200_03040 [Candidatus Gastranaerophilales bacterium]|nr:hypothetical protein [Candidatus Gastranaerophilales bacterium]
MGLSSSQARLLNLTSRMHQIEYKAAKLEAEKLHMANDSKRVYENYLMSLTAHTIGARVLDTDGSVTSTQLTVAKMFEPGALPEQYCVKTMKDNKVIVPQNMYNAYNNTDDLGAFLEELGLVTSFTRTYHEHNDEYDVKVSEFDAAHATWVTNKTRYEIEYPAWQAAQPRQEDFEFFGERLGDTFETASVGCFTAAKNGTFSCYKHVLAGLIDYCNGYVEDKNDAYLYHMTKEWYSGTRTYTTTLGDNVAVGNFASNIGNNDTSCATFNDLSKKLNETNYGKPLYTANTDGETYPTNLDTASDFEKLLSKWDTNTHTGKGLKQWAIDIYAAIDLYNSMDSTTKTANKQVLINSISDFQETMNETRVINTEAYDNAKAQWEAAEPSFYGDEPQLGNYTAGVPEFFVRTQSEITFTDLDLTKYYINIWAQMNKMDSIPEIKAETNWDDALQQFVTAYSVEAEPKSDFSAGLNPGESYDEHDNFIVVSEELLNDPTWLSNIVDGGFVMIQYFNENEKNFKDTSIAVNVNLEEVNDETFLRKAEAQYEADMKRIDLKDRKYDTDLAALDTERNAIKQEIETLKSVAKENVERTFKLFS